MAAPPRPLAEKLPIGNADIPKKVIGRSTRELNLLQTTPQSSTCYVFNSYSRLFRAGYSPIHPSK